MKISNCCSAPDTCDGDHGTYFSDINICPSCKERCVFVEDEDDMVPEDSIFGLASDMKRLADEITK